MSVMVNGMNMPESCLSCPFQEWDGEDIVCYFTGISALNIGRQGTCPLVEAPDTNWIPIRRRPMTEKELKRYRKSTGYTLTGKEAVIYDCKPYKEPYKEEKGER